MATAFVDRAADRTPKVVEVFHCDNSIVIIMEKCNGGELFDRLVQQPQSRFNENYSRQITSALLSALVSANHIRSLCMRQSAWARPLRFAAAAICSVHQPALSLPPPPATCTLPAAIMLREHGGRLDAHAGVP